MGFATLAFIAFMFWMYASRRRAGAADPQLTGAVQDLQDEVAALRGQLDQQRVQMEEMAERLDFSERVVAQLREGKTLQLPPAPPRN